MKLLSICLALILAISFCVTANASGVEYAMPNMVYPVYKYDSESGVLHVSIKYTGERLCAIGLTVVYDVSKLEYTGYSGGSGLSGFDISATLLHNGRINILAFGGDATDGEMISLDFTLCGEHVGEISLELFPLTSISAVTPVDGELRASDVRFLSPRYRITQLKGVGLYCETDGSGVVKFTGDGECDMMQFDIATVDVSSGEISFAQKGFDGGGTFCLDTPSDGYFAVIIEPYYIENNEKIYAERQIFLLLGGEIID